MARESARAGERERDMDRNIRRERERKIERERERTRGREIERDREVNRRREGKRRNRVRTRGRGVRDACLVKARTGDRGGRHKLRIATLDRTWARRVQIPRN